MNICTNWFLHYFQTANHSQLWVVTQTNTNYDLLLLCIPASRDLLYTTKSRDLLYHHEKCLCPHDKSAIILKKLQIEVIICADISENRLPETKNNFSGIDISWPTPSVSLSVPSCSLKVFWMQRTTRRKINCKLLSGCWISCFRDACNRRHSRCV